MIADILLWYLWAQAFAFAGWLVAAQWLRSLPDHGYGASKALGILLGGFLYWMAVTLGLARNEPGAILLALALVVVIGFTLRTFGNRVQPGLSSSFVVHPSSIIATEVIFALAFVGCAIYRAYNPQIVEAGGEKFMESMMLNAILRSPTFPPNDAWLSGFSISYYYFGYVILAMLTKISGVQPSIAFNLGGAMIFALALTSAFSVGYNLYAYAKQHKGVETERQEVEDEREPVNSATHSPHASHHHVAHHPVGSSLLAGMLTALMLGVMGNMGGLMETARCTNVLPQSFWAWIDVRHIEDKPIECKGFLPTRFYWWWDWSRVVHDYTPTGDDQEVITETPAFSFILGDNHPHVLSLPFVLLAITLALQKLQVTRIGQEPDGRSQKSEEGDQNPALDVQQSSIVNRQLSITPGAVADVLLTALIIGGLSFMNTWDFPVYGALVVGALLLGRWYRRESLLRGVVYGVLVFVMGYLLYLPFYATFSSQARGIGVNLFNGTRFVQFFLMFAPFLAAAPLFVWHTARQRRVRVRTAAQTAGLAVAGLVLAVLAAVVLGLLSSQGRAYAAELVSTGTVMGVTREVVSDRLLQRLADPWVPLYLLGLGAACAVLILRRDPELKTEPSALSPQPSKLIHSFVLLLFLGGALLTVAVEFIFLQDLFGTRMNTVFKFYYQGWTVWAVASAFALMTFLDTKGLLAAVSSLLVGALLLAGMLFPIYAAISKTDFFSATPTLDGAAYLQHSHPDDANIIAWLNENVSGAPVIVETPAEQFGAYSYNGRISAFTGLPTLLGWGGHQHQWRGNYDEPARREPLIKALYNSTDEEEAQRILSQFNVRFVIVGDVERATYTSEGLAKFDRLCAVAYQSGNSFVYQCE